MRDTVRGRVAILAALLLLVPFNGFAEDVDSAVPDNAEEAESDLPDKKDPDKIGDRDIDGSVNFYSIEKEIRMGKQYAQDIERQAKLVEDPLVTEYINRIGQNIVRNSDVQVPVSIKVIDSDDVNAFALPGGFFFVNSGLILRAETEAELAGVMAHEIAHIAARHGTRQATKGQIANIASIPLIFMGGWAGYGIRQAASILVPMGFLKFSRAFEREADLLGLQYLYKAGYDPTAFVDFFEKLQAAEKRKPGTMAKVFSSHPPTGDRIEFAQQNIEEILQSKPEYVVTTSEFNEVKSRLAAQHNRMVGQEEEDPDRPRLRKEGSGRVDSKGNEIPEAEDEDERPTLKRRN